jgi:hypothetical protein
VFTPSEEWPLVSPTVNDLIDFRCSAPSHQAPHEAATLIVIHSHWAFCPSGSVADHEWTMTGGVTLQDLVRCGVSDVVIVGP